MLAFDRLAELRWPDFGPLQGDADKLYKSIAYGLVWTPRWRALPQAHALIQAIREATSKGLDAEDYDGSRWDG